MISAVKKAPTLNDSRFHTNNVVASIKALDKWKENGIITDNDKHLIDEQSWLIPFFVSHFGK